MDKDTSLMLSGRQQNAWRNSEWLKNANVLKHTKMSVTITNMAGGRRGKGNETSALSGSQVVLAMKFKG